MSLLFLVSQSGVKQDTLVPNTSISWFIVQQTQRYLNDILVGAKATFIMLILKSVQGRSSRALLGESDNGYYIRNKENKQNMLNYASQRGYQIQNSNIQIPVSISDFNPYSDVFCYRCDTKINYREGHSKTSINGKIFDVPSHFYHLEANRDFQCKMDIQKAANIYKKRPSFSLLQSILTSQLPDIPIEQKHQLIYIPGKVHMVSLFINQFAFELIVQGETIKDFMHLVDWPNMIFIQILDDCNPIQLQGNDQSSFAIQAALKFRFLTDKVQLFFYDNKHQCGYKPDTVVNICKKTNNWQNIQQSDIQLKYTYVIIEEMYKCSLADMIQQIAYQSLIPDPVQFDYKEEIPTYKLAQNHQSEHTGEYLFQNGYLYDYILAVSSIFYYCKSCNQDKWHCYLNQTCKTCNHNQNCNKCIQCVYCQQCNEKMKYIQETYVCTKCTVVFNCNNPKCNIQMLLNSNHCSDTCKPSKCLHPRCDKLIYSQYCNIQCEPQFQCKNPTCNVKMFNNIQYCPRTCKPKICEDPICIVKFHYNVSLRTRKEHCSERCKPKYQCPNPKCKKALYIDKQHCKPKICANSSCNTQIYGSKIYCDADCKPRGINPY